MDCVTNIQWIHSSEINVGQLLTIICPKPYFLFVQMAIFFKLRI